MPCGEYQTHQIARESKVKRRTARANDMEVQQGGGDGGKAREGWGGGATTYNVYEGKLTGQLDPHCRRRTFGAGEFMIRTTRAQIRSRAVGGR